MSSWRPTRAEALQALLGLRRGSALQALDAWVSARLAQRLEAWLVALHGLVQDSRRQHPFLHINLLPTLFEVVGFGNASRAASAGAGRVTLLRLGEAAALLTDQVTRRIAAMEALVLEREPPVERLMN